MNWLVIFLFSLFIVPFSQSQTDSVYLILDNEVIEQNSVFETELIKIYNNLYNEELDSLKNIYGEVLPIPSAHEFFYFQVYDQYFVSDKEELRAILCDTNTKTALNMSRESWFKKYYRNYFIVRRLGEEKIKIYKTSIMESE